MRHDGDEDKVKMDECEKKLKDWEKRSKKLKISMRVELGGQYFEKKLSPRMICALFDLQYMLHHSTWNTLKLNNMEKEIAEFFSIIEHVDDGMHGNEIGIYDDKKKMMIFRKKRKGEYLFGKPVWKKIRGGLDEERVDR